VTLVVATTVLATTQREGKNENLTLSSTVVLSKSLRAAPVGIVTLTA